MEGKNRGKATAISLSLSLPGFCVVYSYRKCRISAMQHILLLHCHDVFPYIQYIMEKQLTISVLYLLFATSALYARMRMECCFVGFRLETLSCNW